MKLIKMAIAIKPDYAEAYYNMGIALKEKCKLEEAIKAYTKVLSIKLDHYIEAYNPFGKSLRARKIRRSNKNIYNALTIRPGYAEA